MKYVSIRIPEDGPLGETFFEASDRAITGALFVKNPSGGCVESVATFRTQRRDAPAAGFFAPDPAEDFVRDLLRDLPLAPPRFLAALSFVGMTQCLLKYCTARSCCSAFTRELNVPRLRRLPVEGFFFFEYSR